MKTCSIDGCSKKHRCKGFCDIHYRRMRRFGHTDIRIYPTVCSVELCNGRVVGKGFCKKHYYRFHYNGDPMRLKKRENGRGYYNDAGYKIIYKFGKRIREHRYIMERHIGRPLLKSEIVHHKDGNCRNNAIENLQIVQSALEHMTLHKKFFSDSDRKECSKCRRIQNRSYFRKASVKRLSHDINASMCIACHREYGRPYDRIRNIRRCAYRKFSKIHCVVKSELEKAEADTR